MQFYFLELGDLGNFIISSLYLINVQKKINELITLKICSNYLLLLFSFHNCFHEGEYSILKFQKFCHYFVLFSEFAVAFK